MWTSHPVTVHTFSILASQTCLSLGLPVLATANNVQNLQWNVDGIRIIQKLENFTDAIIIKATCVTSRSRVSIQKVSLEIERREI